MRIGLAGLPSEDLDWIVESMRGRCEDLEESSVLVTGASGFIGRWIVASLVEMRRRSSLPNMIVDVLVRDPATAEKRLGRELWDELEVHHADINAYWRLDRPITHVVHGATPSSVRSGAGFQRDVLVTSVVGTQNLIRAVGNEEQPPRVLHLSSGAIYGPQPSDLERIPETWVGAPTPFLATSPYAEGKRAAEALLEAGSREGLIAPIHARLFAFLGPGLPTGEGYAIGNFVLQALRGQRINVVSDGSAVRSYLDARDLATWLLSLLLSGRPGTPYNVGSPIGHTLGQWAELCADMCDVSVSYGSAAVGERAYYVPDTENSSRLGIPDSSRDARSAILSWMTWLGST